MTAARTDRSGPHRWLLADALHTLRSELQDIDDMTATTLTETAPADPKRNQEWTDNAACRGQDPEIWFPVATGLRGTEESNRAKAVCAGCLVQRPCLSWALTALPFGVAGGLTAEERSDLRAKRGAA